MQHPGSDGRFATTQWSLVLGTGDGGDESSRQAMERLCARYWYPIYAFIRRLGNDIHTAEDLTQGFFEFVIQHHLIQKARRERGRFRSYILTSLHHFLHNHHAHATAAKRGGRVRHVSLDDSWAEALLASEPPG